MKKTPVPGGPKSGYRYLCIILIISDFQDSFTGRLASKFPMKKSAQRNCSKAEPKIFAPSQTPFSGGRGTAKIQSAGDGHYFYLQTQFGEDRCTQFRVIVVKDPPTHKHTQTDRTDYNTLRGAPQLACSVIRSSQTIVASRGSSVHVSEAWA